MQKFSEFFPEDKKIEVYLHLVTDEVGRNGNLEKYDLDLNTCYAEVVFFNEHLYWADTGYHHKFLQETKDYSAEDEDETPLFDETERVPHDELEQYMCCNYFSSFRNDKKYPKLKKHFVRKGTSYETVCKRALTTDGGVFIPIGTLTDRNCGKTEEWEDAVVDVNTENNSNGGGIDDKETAIRVLEYLLSGGRLIFGDWMYDYGPDVNSSVWSWCYKNTKKEKTNG